MTRFSLRTTARTAIATASDLRFDPGRDTALAVGSLLAFWPIYYLNWASDSITSAMAFLVVGNFLLTVLAPIYYVAHVRGEPLSELGLTTDRWKSAVLCSTVLGIALLPELLTVGLPTATLVAHTVTIGLMFWEPFFVHGWLQLRFERAFGPVAGIVLASVGFTLFHVGTRSIEGLAVLLLVGLCYAIVFRVVGRNLLALWPIAWAIGGAQGTLGSDLVFGWGEAGMYAVLLLGIGGAVYAVSD